MPKDKKASRVNLNNSDNFEMDRKTEKFPKFSKGETYSTSDLKDFIAQEFRNLKQMILEQHSQCIENRKILLALESNFRYADTVQSSTTSETVIKRANGTDLENVKEWFPIQTKEQLVELDNAIKTNKSCFIEYIREILGDGGLKKNFERIFASNIGLSFNYNGTFGRESLRDFKNVTDILLVALQHNLTNEQAIVELRTAFQKCKAKEYQRRRIERKKSIMFDSLAEFHDSDMKSESKADPFNDLDMTIKEEKPNDKNISENGKDNKMFVDFDNITSIEHNKILEKNYSPKKRKRNSSIEKEWFPVTSQSQMDALERAIKEDPTKFITKIEQIINSNGIVKSFTKLFSDDILCTYSVDGDKTTSSFKDLKMINFAIFNALNFNGDYTEDQYMNDVHRSFKRFRKQMKKRRNNDEH